MGDDLKQIRRLINQGEFKQAILVSQSLHDDDPLVLEVQAIAYSALGKDEEAYQYQSKALALAPHNTGLKKNLAVFAIKTHRHDVACQTLKDLYDPNAPDLGLLFNLVISAQKSGLDEETQKYCKTYLELDKSNLQIWRILVKSYVQGHQLEKALETYSSAQKHHKLAHQDYFNIGLVARDLGLLDDAEQAFVTALLETPDHVDSHFEYAQCLLARGQMADGFQEFEWRLQKANAPKWSYFPPLHKHETSESKRLLVYTEQGAGDAIHFSRYLRILEKHNIDYHLLCHPAIVPLFKELGLPASSHTDSPPVCDRQCSLLSLPYLYDIYETPIAPSIPPTLSIDHSTTSEKLNVGICWTGSKAFANNALRSCGLEPISHLLEINGVNWVSLMPDTSDDIREKYNLSTPLNLNSNYLETAHIIKNLDLVITVDTSVAHLSGLLGKKTWIILHSSPDWRWTSINDQSTLYPSLTIYKQENYGQWESVIDRIKTNLIALTKK
ncbi:tetratricopeptide repeat protein [Terasakiella sp. A23]|uniref:tetratricopeptide repeat protein n=1 Tax=Terasakiella sp. FCG-A23 TaxID=3080561 RepID=UPI002953586E|nr:tetratricopeptide repeat protein [Terasakiella sp. A23]MDV7339040.1 tetratricopeptide repeat protein [Terasakiella sp. A23]